MSEPAVMMTGHGGDIAGDRSDPRLAVAIRDLHVDFRVYAERKLTVRELVGRGFRSRESFVVEAVAGVTLDIAVGEAVGIVGTNGSGKSTLLRAIAGLQSPTQGQVLVRSQPHLLGVAPALSAGLSGRRNIELGALAMGMRLSEVSERMEEVIDFSGLRKAIDRPLNTYSSGMRARLAFSIATLQTPEILLIDEALAVGDRRFKRRSLRRVRQIQESAGTILMVTHNLNEIRAVCGRTIWMSEGRIVDDGPTAEVLERYIASDDAED